MSIQLDDLVARLRLDSSGVGSGLSSLNGSLGKVGANATAAGKRMTLGITTPIVGLGVASTNLAANFDKTMRLVAVATDGPSKALSDLAKKMGAETAFSAGEAADAMLELAKGGMTAAQIEGGALAATMKLATAGGVDLANASTYVSNSMAAFGLSAKDADKVTVALAGAANASSASVESLGMGLSQAASSARNAGLSLQETTGVLSYFDSVGLKGSDAGTSLKSMFNGLIPTTNKAAKAQREANLDFVDAEGNFVSVAEMADQLKKGLGGLGEAQRAQALETIFGSDGMRAASALMRGGREEVVKFTKASRDQATTTKLANAAMEGTAGAMERARGSIETAGLAIGQVLAPHVERAAAKVEELANKFTALSPETQGMIVKGLALAAVVGPLTIGLGVMASSLSKIVGAASLVSGGIGKLTGSLAEGETRMSRFGGAAKSAAGVGGLVALTYGLKKAHDEGTTFSSVMAGAAGGAGIGAMFGPIGALIGAGAGAGLTALAGSFHKTAAEAEAARIELQRTKGFEQAKADADTLAEALLGVVNAYGRVPRAAIEASFTGEDGKLDADIQKLRDLGVSMDTIVSATLGQADAQKIVDKALRDSITPLQQRADAAKASLDKVENTTQRTSEATDKARAKYDAAANALKEATDVQDVFADRTRRNTGALVNHQREVGKLAALLGLTREQYLRLPKDVRTKVEADGLPQTSSDALLLIDRYKGLQNFRNIKTIVEATGAPLSTRQVEELKRKYDLTPKQVKTLVQAVGIDGEIGKLQRMRREAEDTAGTYNVNVHTQYTYSGLKSPTRSSDERVDVNPRQLIETSTSGSGGKTPEETGYDYAAETMQGMTLGFRAESGAAQAEAEKTGEKTGDALADGIGKKAEKVKKAVGKIVSVMYAADPDAPTKLELLGETLSDSFAEGIVGNSTHVAQAMQQLFTQLDAVHNNLATQLATRARDKLGKLGDLYASVSAQLLGAQNALEAFEAARQAVVARQSALSGAGGDVTTLTFGEDDKGIALPPSAERIVAALQTVQQRAAEFETNLQRLKDAGLSQDALDQLIAKGPEAAGATAAAILAGGAATITEINSLQGQIAATALAIQAQSSTAMYDAGVAAQQGLIAGLESQMTTLEEQMNRIAKAMVKAIRRALKIKSPSRVMDQLGEYSGLGFAQGLDSTTRAVAAASTRMSAAALVDVPAYADPNVASLAARRAARGVSTSSPTPEFRVFIGDRELTDIVRVEIGGTLAPLQTLTRQGA